MSWRVLACQQSQWKEERREEEKKTTEAKNSHPTLGLHNQWEAPAFFLFFFYYCSVSVNSTPFSFHQTASQPIYSHHPSVKENPVCFPRKLHPLPSQQRRGASNSSPQYLTCVLQEQTISGVMKSTLLHASDQTLEAVERERRASDPDFLRAASMMVNPWVARLGALPGSSRGWFSRTHMTEVGLTLKGVGN